MVGIDVGIDVGVTWGGWGSNVGLPQKVLTDVTQFPKIRDSCSRQSLHALTRPPSYQAYTTREGHVIIM